ncbi:MAG TPA: ABC transporter ATP-binding protein [Candidatus Scybalocola faecavium]|nr:ABC transporter ATP-binding protein [Candidatus Scybalocola faecavium]
MYTREKLLQVHHLHKSYEKDGIPVKALNGISFDVFSGEFLGIMGASGSGKTTLLNCIATILKPTSGQILLSGENISLLSGNALAQYRGEKIGYLFQDFALLDNLTGRENILLPLSIHSTGQTKRIRKKAPEKNSEPSPETRLMDIAGLLGIQDILLKFPSQMSGGQKQRVAAARCLISNPEIVLADEPTGALDTRSARQLMERLQEINSKKGTTILMVTHNPSAASYCSRILFIQDGKVFHELRRDQETQNNFYQRILNVMAQMGGGSANVL